MTRPEESDDSASNRSELTRVDRFLEPLFTDAALHPLLLVIGLTLVTFGTGLVLMAARSRNPFAMASVVLLVVMSVETVQRDIRRRGFGPTSRIVVGFWAATGLCASAIVWMDWY